MSRRLKNIAKNEGLKRFGGNSRVRQRDTGSDSGTRDQTARHGTRQRYLGPGNGTQDWTARHGTCAVTRPGHRTITSPNCHQTSHYRSDCHPTFSRVNYHQTQARSLWIVAHCPVPTPQSEVTGSYRNKGPGRSTSLARIGHESCFTKTPTVCIFYFSSNLLNGMIWKNKARTRH